jgi:hypothetical protein
MNFGKGGQNIVQSGNNNPNVFRGVGGILETFLGTKMRVAERDYHREKDEESRIRVNKAQTMDRAGADIFKAMVLPGAAAVGATKAYAIANETLGKDHPDVVAGLKPADTLKHPEMAHQVNNYGFDVGYRPAKTPPSKVQSDAIAERLRNSGEEITKQSDGYSGTVARFGKDGKITREPVSYGDIGVEESFSQRPPASMLNTDESTRPSNQTFTPQQKADLEKERPRTNGLNDGINDGKGGNY